uniref:Capsid protein n=1 Tax=Carnation mottle virus TaxID=11986 RepID=F8SPH7_CARMV|nr:coat protein [Carnation mottle virus]
MENKGEKIAMNPTVQTLAQKGDKLAVKLVTRGWASLSTNQKRRAEMLAGYTPAILAFTPRRPRMTNPPPRTSRNSPGQAGKSMTMSKTELLSTVKGTTGVIPSFEDWVVSPRNVAVFPQLSLLATNFNKYRITALTVKYSPACSFETNGRVALGFNDDASDTPPTTKVGFYDLGKHVETAAQTAKDLVIPVDGKTRFIRDSASDDAKLVDFGRIVLSTYGFDKADTVVGELFIQYTIVLSDPTKTAKISQASNDKVSDGPTYVVPSVNGNELQLRVVAAGKWCFIVRGTVEGGFTKPTLIGPGISGDVDYESARPIAICELVTQMEGQILKITKTSAEQPLQWVVYRM